ncbi:hypothetical protein MNBD_NITROSPINAE02-1503 [hydrothermal vent metagenome]|uniref:Uncharacterized protein n=1 Tax=hydrothermal vent metagenome TaxID=652676 RepID=A0A3B1C2D5_9ZZZZ
MKKLYRKRDSSGDGSIEPRKEFPMNKMMIAASMGAFLTGAVMIFTGCGPATGSAPFLQINSQDESNNSNDNNAPEGEAQANILTVANEDPLVRVSCEGPKMNGEWSGSCRDAYTQGVFSCPGETSLQLCADMCFIYGDAKVCI